MTTGPIPTLLLFLLTWAAVQPATAKENRTEVDLAYSPKQQAGTSSVDASLRGVPVAVQLTDRRGLEDAARIGSRTDGRDRVHDLRATTDVPEFLRQTVATILDGWQIAVSETASLKLAVEVSSYEAQETNRSVGADYEAVVRLGLRLSEGDRELWKGGVSASASRYGKKFSNDHVNEVLSDALLEALAGAMATPALRDAWAASGGP